MADRTTKARIAPPPHDLQFEPLLTADDIRTGEAHQNGEGSIAATRRISMSVLGRSKAQLVKSFRTKEDLFVELFDAVYDYAKHAEASLKLAQAARARMTIVGATILHERKKARSRRRTRGAA